MAKQQQNEYDEAMMARAQAELLAAQQQSPQQTSYNAAMFGSPNKQNIVEWELDFASELIDIERLLRCDILTKDKNGNEIWINNPDKSAVFLNKRGVDDVLRQIILLVNKNKVLSNYNVEEIRQRVHMIGHELRSFIYNNYMEYDIDNEYKMNNFAPIVLAILDVIEAAFRRALNGETHKGLSEARFVQQNEPIMPNNFAFNMMSQQPRKGLLSKLNPFSWNK